MTADALHELTLRLTDDDGDTLRLTLAGADSGYAAYATVGGTTAGLTLADVDALTGWAALVAGYRRAIVATTRER